MSAQQTGTSAVKKEVDEQRGDSEVKDIINDLDRLKSVPVDRKTRWIWELIQNAKDCAPEKNEDGKAEVDIEIVLQKGKLIFSHNGKPFKLKNLVSLVTRTSDKDYNKDRQEGGVSTGKYGTGFVTSHVLNRKVTISGMLDNETGLRKFSILLDRTSDDHKELRTELDRLLYEELDPLNLLPAEEKTDDVISSFEYALDPDGWEFALASMQDMENNIAFTLLINPVISSVTVKNLETKETKRYSASKEREVFPGIFFSALETGTEKTEDKIEGLLYDRNADLIIAVPVESENGFWHLKAIKNAVKLYKEFPLMGTEKWHLPYYVQSAKFSPPETRDGLRTLKDKEGKTDPVADQNRIMLEQFKDFSIAFFKKLVAVEKVQNIFLLTDSGVPEERTEYTNEEWYAEKIQGPLRRFFKSYPLLRTASGRLIPIGEAKIPQHFELPEDNATFYKTAVQFYGDVFPEEKSYEDWQRILSQQPESWGATIFLTVEQLVADVQGTLSLSGLQTKKTSCDLAWLSDLIDLVYQVDKVAVISNAAIYPDQNGNFKKREALRIDPPLNPVLKSVSVDLNISVLNQLVKDEIKNKSGIDLFNSKAWFDTLNIAIGRLLVPDAGNIEKFKSVLRIPAVFRNAAPERDKWHGLIKELLPAEVPVKEYVKDLDEFIFDPAEFASVRYVCWLIDGYKTWPAFVLKYFPDDEKRAFEWFNDFISVLHRNKDYYPQMDAYAVIPTQDDQFRKYNKNLYVEATPFPELFKTLYKDCVKKDAEAILIKLGIDNQLLEREAPRFLTGPVDDLFAPASSEQSVKENGDLNKAFHMINGWLTDHEDQAETLFPHFSSRRPMLYVNAYGPAVSKLIMAVSKLNWKVEEIESLSSLNLQPEEIEKLKKASEMAGGIDRLMRAANEIAKELDKAAWRKKIGDKAEDSFTGIIENLQAKNLNDESDYDLSNKDQGFDFEIHLGNLESFMVEIKSTILSKGNIKMSGLQGRTARNHANRYALCVVTREEADTEVTADYFKKHARFVTDIGTRVRDKVNGMENGLTVIKPLKEGEINSLLENENYSVYVSRSIWKDAMPFERFVEHIQHYFQHEAKPIQPPDSAAE